MQYALVIFPSLNIKKRLAIISALYSLNWVKSVKKIVKTPNMITYDWTCIYQEDIKQKEAELAERELTLLQRELNMMIVQQQAHNQTPTPRKRKGKFR